MKVLGSEERWGVTSQKVVRFVCIVVARRIWAAKVLGSA